MDDEVQQIKDRINIVDIVGQYMTLRRAGRSWTGKCPFHKERTPSFHVSPERGTYKCFGCGEGGDVFSFVQKMDGTDFVTVLRQLAEKAGIKLEPRSGKARAPEEKEKEERLREVCEAAVAFFEQVLSARTEVLEYLKNRGVHDDTIKNWCLGYAPAEWESLSKHLRSLGISPDEIVEAGFGIKSEKRPGEVFDRFRGRIIFPIFDVAGKPIAVSGRFFEKVPGGRDDGEPAKYVNSPETLLFKKSRTLYGLDRARSSIRKLDCILLVEGQFDLVLAHQSGLPFAVALSGTALTPEHLSLLGRLSKRLVLALDADQAGLRSGLKSAHMALTQGFDVKVPVFPEGKDPADLARENPELLKAAVRTSKTAVEFFLDALRPAARDARAYAKIVEVSVLPLVAAVGSSIEQEQYLRLIAGRLGVSETAIRTELGKVKAQSREMVGGPISWDSSEIQQRGLESDLTPLERKIGMVLFGWSQERTKLESLVGVDVLAELERRLQPQAESLRFRFDAEVGEHTSEAVIAEDMLGEIARQQEKERFKMKFL
ncbi:DNA primase [Candidatus Kaiserbacteria bacterium]|nr:DNA primase [Candidatus Kaiserbacteria bacterium]